MVVPVEMEFQGNQMEEVWLREVNQLEEGVSGYGSLIWSRRFYRESGRFAGLFVGDGRSWVMKKTLMKPSVFFLSGCYLFVGVEREG